ncbi:helix-turn-helix domain-containing protein, partial [Francisella tularensis]|nr:ATP-binding protein [Francisella tularensis subsp. holarctica]
MNILQRIHNGEDSYTQFKKDINNAYILAQELVAFSNAIGCILIIGV